MSMIEHTFPTRYEYFEAWLTPKEWAVWKKGSIAKIMYNNSVTESEAKKMRKKYLEERHDFEGIRTATRNIMFEVMIDEYLIWRNTAQGLEYWQNVAMRTRPIRTL